MLKRQTRERERAAAAAASYKSMMKEWDDTLPHRILEWINQSILLSPTRKISITNHRMSNRHGSSSSSNNNNKEEANTVTVTALVVVVAAVLMALLLSVLQEVVTLLVQCLLSLFPIRQSQFLFVLSNDSSATIILENNKGVWWLSYAGWILSTTQHALLQSIPLLCLCCVHWVAIQLYLRNEWFFVRVSE